VVREVLGAGALFGLRTGTLGPKTRMTTNPSPIADAMALVCAGIGFFAGILLMHCLVAGLRSDIIPDDQRWTHEMRSARLEKLVKRVLAESGEAKWVPRLHAVAIRAGQAPVAEPMAEASCNPATPFLPGNDIGPSESPPSPALFTLTHGR
jgi:hypothetical protein